MNLPNLEQEWWMRLEHSSDYDYRRGEQTLGTPFQPQSFPLLTKGTNVKILMHQMTKHRYAKVKKSQWKSKDKEWSVYKLQGVS